MFKLFNQRKLGKSFKCYLKKYINEKKDTFYRNSIGPIHKLALIFFSISWLVYHTSTLICTGNVLIKQYSPSHWVGWVWRNKFALSIDVIGKNMCNPSSFPFKLHFQFQYQINLHVFKRQILIIVNLVPLSYWSIIDDLVR